jgi:hypothetical protein
VIVVGPNDGSSYVDRLFAEACLDRPPAFRNWDDTIDDWCDEYVQAFDHTRLLEIYIDRAVYWFDQGDAYERTLVAYGISATPTDQRDANRMRHFPDVNVGIEVNLGDAAFKADRGHFLSHASGGELDINLFPQRRALNRGWSDEGKVFRQMERYAADRPGTFQFHRAMYDDDTWIPDRLEFGVLTSNGEWWIEQFANK